MKRYTTETFAHAKQWRSWLSENRSRLFFTDVGGFKFLVAPESLIAPLGRVGPSRSALEMAQEPDTERPVTATAELSPATINPGESSAIVIRVKMAPAWHIYSAEGSNGPGVSTTLTLTLPEGLEADGPWLYPKTISGSDNEMIYQGSLEFRRKLRVRTDAATGPVSVTCEFGYQACDPVSCRPPAKVLLSAKAEILGAKSKR